MITLDQAKDHLRLDDDDNLVSLYLSAASLWVAQYLNRRLFSNDTALIEAKNGAQAILQAASTQLEVDLEAAASVTDARVREELIQQAYSAFRAAVTEYREILNGMLSNESTDAATLLVLGDLYENREAGIVGVSYENNPTVLRLLNPYRVGMGV